MQSSDSTHLETRIFGKKQNHISQFSFLEMLTFAALHYKIYLKKN